MTDQVLTRTRVAVAVVSFCVAVLLDLFYFPRDIVFPDEQRFLDSAVRLAQSGSFYVGNDRAWEMPGTALFFAGFFALFGKGQTAIIAIRVVQAALLSLQAFLIGTTAQRIFSNRWTGLIATLMTGFYPFLLFYQGLLLSETLFTTLLVAGFASLFWWRERGLKVDRAFAIACLCFAAATMTKATLTFLPPILFAVAMLSARDVRSALRILVIAALFYAALLSPWWIRNTVQLHAFVPFTTSAASNLYLGNNFNNPHVGIDWKTDVDPRFVQALTNVNNELERQRLFNVVAVRFIYDNPSGFLYRATLKFRRFWNIIPNAAEFKGGIYALISAATFGPVLLLSIITALVWWRLFPVLLPIYLLIGYFTAVHMVTIASLRYRFPLEPFLILLAAGSLGAVFTRYLSGAKMDATPNPTTAI